MENVILHFLACVEFEFQGVQSKAKPSQAKPAEWGGGRKRQWRHSLQVVCESRNSYLKYYFSTFHITWREVRRRMLHSPRPQAPLGEVPETRKFSSVTMHRSSHLQPARRHLQLSARRQGPRDLSPRSTPALASYSEAVQEHALLQRGCLDKLQKRLKCRHGDPKAQSRRQQTWL